MHRHPGSEPLTDEQVLAYVKAAALAVYLPLDDARASRVAQHLARTAEMARQLERFALEASDEQAEIYNALAFPAAPDGPDPA